MAKKKVSQKDKPTQNQDQTHQTTAMEDTPEKLKHLKSLNSMLLKETVEHRQQMDSLLQSKGSLESELALSETVKEALQADLTRLHDRTVRMELERNLVYVFISVQVNQQSEVIEKERREKAETEKRLQDMETEMREILREKSEKDCELDLMKRKLDQFVVEVDNERYVSSQLCQERDKLRTEVEDLIGEINGLKSELYDLRCQNEVLEKKVGELLVEVDRERDSNYSMSAELDFQTEETIELKLKLTESEKREKKIQEEVHKLRTEYANLMEEKEESERKVKMTMAVKDKFERCLIDSNWVNEELKGNIEEMVREKEGIEKERKVEVEKKIELENEVSALKEKVGSLQKEEERLRLSFANMEKRCIDGVEKQNQMVMEINKLEEAKKMERSFERLNGENDVVIKELQKKIEETHRVVKEMKTENCSLIGEKKELESRCARLMNEMASLKSTLSKTRIEFDEMQVKVKLLDANSELVLNMLKKTASQACPSKDETGVVEDCVLIDEQEVGEEMKLYLAQLDAIKSSFRKRESEVEDMKRQLEFLRNSTEEAHKKKSFWTLVSSVTTVFAAASVAYVACA